MYDEDYNNNEDNHCDMPFDANVHQLEQSLFLDKNSRRKDLQKIYKVTKFDNSSILSMKYIHYPDFVHLN